MKIFKVFYFCLAALVFAACIYLSDFKEIVSFYLLAGTLAGFFLIMSGLLAIDIFDKKKTRENIVFSLFAMLLALGFLSYRQITNYKRGVCQDKFGPEFNTRRRSLGIPEIPANWYVESRGRFSVKWQAKDSKIGHESKRIDIDSACAIKAERDKYNLKPLHGKARGMSIFFGYARGKDKGFLSFQLDDVDSTHTLSRQQADSIFAAEKIRKDY